MVESLIPYSELWELLSQHPQAYLLLNKLSIMYSEKIPAELAQQKLISYIFHSLQKEEEKVLFVIYEFYRENWTTWLPTSKWSTIKNPQTTLRLALLSTGLSEEKFNSTFLAPIMSLELAADPV